MQGHSEKHEPALQPALSILENPNKSGHVCMSQPSLVLLCRRHAALSGNSITQLRITEAAQQWFSTRGNTTFKKVVGCPGPKWYRITGLGFPK